MRAGLLAMPGLINTHAHVPMGIFRGLAEDVDIETWFNEYIWPLEANLTAEDVYWGMQLGLAEMISAGVTAVADHYFHMDRAAAAVERAGTRAALGWAVFGSQGEAGIERTASFAEEFNGAADGRITTWLAPHAPYTCDDDFLAAVASEAERLGLGIHIHAAETKGQTEASLAAHGRTPIRILADTGILDRPTILAHCCGVTADDIELMAKAGCGVAHAPKTYLKLAMGAAPVLEMRAAGIPVGLASDGPVSNNTLDIFEALRLMAMVAKHEAGDSREIAGGCGADHRDPGERESLWDAERSRSSGSGVFGGSDPRRSRWRPQPTDPRPRRQPGLLDPRIGCADGDLRWQGHHARPSFADPRSRRDQGQGGGEHDPPVPTRARLEDPALQAVIHREGAKDAKSSQHRKVANAKTQSREENTKHRN